MAPKRSKKKTCRCRGGSNNVSQKVNVITSGGTTPQAIQIPIPIHVPMPTQQPTFISGMSSDYGEDPRFSRRPVRRDDYAYSTQPDRIEPVSRLPISEDPNIGMSPLDVARNNSYIAPEEIAETNAAFAGESALVGDINTLKRPALIKILVDRQVITAKEARKREFTKQKLIAMIRATSNEKS